MRLGSLRQPCGIARMTYTGSVECRSSGPRCMTFVGRTSAGESAYLSLVGQVPEDLPARLDAASVDRIDAGHYRIAAGERIWTMSVSRCDLHCDLGERFYRAVPPRRAPLSRRILWRLVLAAARTPIAGWWLTRR